MTPMLHPPCSTVSPREIFFCLFPWMKKVLKGKYFAGVKEEKQKTAKVLKGIKIYKFKNCFEQWKKVLIGVLHQMESTLKVTED